MTETAPTIDRDQLTDLCREACRAAGASDQVADLLTEAALTAEDRGSPAVGVAHLLDYLNAMDAGRLDGRAEPQVHASRGAVLVCDARGGVAHAGFAQARSDLVAAARSQGVAVFAQHSMFTCGALGWFTEQLADEGLIAVATATSPALMSPAPGAGRVFGTNPMAYSMPRAGRPAFTVDQATSAVAFVSVRAAAERGEPIPEGWAVDEDGAATIDPQAALAGSLLPFGGYKGANLAWLVELLSSAAGGIWSIDAPAFDRGADPPGVGMWVLALDPEALAPGFPARAEEHVERLAAGGVRRPGSAEHDRVRLERLSIPNDVIVSLRRRVDPAASTTINEGASDADA